MVTSLSLSGQDSAARRNFSRGGPLAGHRRRQPARQLAGRVVRCEELVSGEFDCGVEFF